MSAAYPHRALICVSLMALAPGADAQYFADVSASSGFAPSFLANLPAGGIAVADFDGNGWPDIFVTGYYEPNRLFFNQGDGTFQQSPAINAQVAGQQCAVAAAADYDNDGWADIYVGCRNQSNLLLRNLAGVGFEQAIVPAINHGPVSANSPRTDSVAWGDIDGNGLLDLHVGVYVNEDEPDLANPDNIDRIALQTAPGIWQDVAPGLPMAWRDRLARMPYASVFADLDQDGRPDLYIANDKFRGNVFWRNEGPGCGGWCFSDASAAAGIGQSTNGMGIAIGDVDHDGDWDLWYSALDEQFFMRAQSTSPLLYVREPASALNHVGVGWGTVFVDLDNDGWDDAYLAVGTGGFSTTGEEDQLYRNASGQFVRITSEIGQVAQNLPTQAVARIDYDRDGRVDLVMSHWNDGFRLYRNIKVTTNQWLALSLEGNGPVNRSAVGAVAEVRTPDGLVQRKELRAGESRASSHEPILHFGLGPHAAAQVSVRWPDGSRQDFGSLGSGIYHGLVYERPDPIHRDGFEP